MDHVTEPVLMASSEFGRLLGWSTVRARKLAKRLGLRAECGIGGRNISVALVKEKMPAAYARLRENLSRARLGERPLNVPVYMSIADASRLLSGADADGQRDPGSYHNTRRGLMREELLCSDLGSGRTALAVDRLRERCPEVYSRIAEEQIERELEEEL